MSAIDYAMLAAPKILTREIAGLGTLYVKDVFLSDLEAFNQFDVPFIKNLFLTHVVTENGDPLFENVEAIGHLPLSVFKILQVEVMAALTLSIESQTALLNDTVDAMASDAGIAEAVKAELGNDETPTTESP
jgi:hypothetical protein